MRFASKNTCIRIENTHCQPDIPKEKNTVITAVYFVEFNLVPGMTAGCFGKEDCAAAGRGRRADPAPTCSCSSS